MVFILPETAEEGKMYVPEGMWPPDYQNDNLYHIYHIVIW